MKITILAPLLLLFYNSISQSHVYEIKRVRAHVKNEAAFGKDWLTDVKNVEMLGNVTINPAQSIVSIKTESGIQYLLIINWRMPNMTIYFIATPFAVV